MGDGSRLVRVRHQRGYPAQRARRASLVVGACLAVLVPAGVAPAPSDAAPIALNLSAADGAGRISRPGLPCSGGGQGASWHYEYDTPLTPGQFSGLPGKARFHLDLHSNDPAVDASGPATATSSGFLLDDETQLALTNQRGAVRLSLKSGSCGSPTMAFDGTNASGSGTWAVTSASGGYRQATGSGTFVLNAEVAPGANNAYSVSLNGAINVIQPQLKVTVARVYWGFLGVDYLLRRPTVVYRVENIGPGDAYNVRLTKASSPTPGVTLAKFATPQHLGDLRAEPESEATEIRLRWNFGPLDPCINAALCTFRTRLAFRMGDALDVTKSATTAPLTSTTPPPGPSP